MIEDLIELAKNEVPITMSSLIRTVFKEPDKALKYIKNGQLTYKGKTNKEYKYCIIEFKIGYGHYYMYVINYNNKQKEYVATPEDQVIIIDIRREKIDIFTNNKYI